MSVRTAGIHGKTHSVTINMIFVEYNILVEKQYIKSILSTKKGRWIKPSFSCEIMVIKLITRPRE